MSEENKDEDYLKYGESGFDIEDLEKLKDTVFSVGGGPFKTFIGIFKLLALGAYFFARHKLVEEKILIEKNKKRQEQINEDRNDVNNNL